MSKDCATICPYYKECFSARIMAGNDTELQLFGGMLDAGDVCLNDPPEQYKAGGYYNECAILNAAGIAVEFASKAEMQLPAFNFYAQFLNIRRPER